MVYIITDANWDSGTKFHLLVLVLFIAMHLQFLISLMKQKTIFHEISTLEYMSYCVWQNGAETFFSKWESSGDVLKPSDYTYHYWTVHLK